jgi:hypothetical protein
MEAMAGKLQQKPEQNSKSPQKQAAIEPKACQQNDKPGSGSDSQES